MLKLENISKYYYSGNNVVLALRKIDLEFRSGEFVAITGKSGSGKSTLLNVLSGLDTYEDGKMYVNGIDVSHYTIKELEVYRKQYIGFVFQDYNIIDSYTVFQNIELALIIQGYDKTKRKARVLKLIENVGLTSVMNQKASECSGGEKQRTVIARALAKNCSVIVCDEPTGNLDNEASRNVLKLLHDISADKLVIVVTHNYEELKDFATRKVRLHDGEIIEDNLTKNEFSLNESFTEIKPYKTNLRDILKIALINTLSVPKKSFFSGLIITLMILSFIFAYGLTLKEQNTSLVDESTFFENVFQSRVVVNKRDDSAFSADELADLAKLEYVREVVDYDLVFDSTYVNVVYNQETQLDEFYLYKVLPSAGLDEFDLIRGRLPKNKYEIVIGENDFYDVDDYIEISNEYIIKKFQGIKTDEYVFKVVGVVKQSLTIEDTKNEIYFHSDTLLEMRHTAFAENAQKFLVIDNSYSYAIVNDIRIDNSLDDDNVLAYDMMFFDICRDLGYRKEVVDDFDAGLCSFDYISWREFGINVFTRYENLNEPVDIVLRSVPIYPNVFGQGVYVNRNTYNKLFDDDVYQPSVIVYDMFEAKQVKEELEEMGYNVFYPSGVIDEDDALSIVVRNLQLTLTLGITVVVVYFVGYFVMRNVIVSKKKDYLIYRSVGASKKTINNVLVFEILYLTLVSFVIVIGLLMINENFNTVIPRLLRYFNLYNYIVILLLINLLMIFMSHNFNSKIFEKSVISSLKAE